MTDFFDDLERELRRAHRRDTESHARSRVFDLRRLPGLPAAGLRALVALAVIVAVVAVVLAVGRVSDVERPAAPRPQPNANGDTPPVPTPREAAAWIDSRRPPWRREAGRAQRRSGRQPVGAAVRQLVPR